MDHFMKSCYVSDNGMVRVKLESVDMDDFRKQYEVALESSRKQKEDLENKLQKLQVIYNEKNDACHKLVLENGKLRESIKEWKFHSDGKKKQIYDLEVKLKLAQEELEAANAKLVVKDREIDKSRQSALDQIEKSIERERKLNQLQNMLNVATAEVASCRDAVLTFGANDRKNTERIRCLEIELAHNESNVLEAKKISEGHSLYMAKMVEKDEKIKNLTRELEKCQRELKTCSEIQTNLLESVGAKETKITELESKLKSIANVVTDLEEGITGMIASEREKHMKIVTLENELKETEQRLNSEIDSLKTEQNLYEKFIEEMKMVAKWQDDEEDGNLEVRLSKLGRHFKKVGAVYDYFTGKMRARKRPAETSTTCDEDEKTHKIAVIDDSRESGADKTEHDVMGKRAKLSSEAAQNTETQNEDDENEFVDVEALF